MWSVFGTTPPRSWDHNPRGGRAARRKERRDAKWNFYYFIWNLNRIWEWYWYPDESSYDDSSSNKRSRTDPRPSSSSSRAPRPSSSSQQATSSGSRDLVPTPPDHPPPNRSELVPNFPPDAFEVSSESEVEIVVEQTVNYRSARCLRDVSLGTDQIELDLPTWLPGKVLINKLAFYDWSVFDFEILQESLRGAVVLDLYKTVIYPERLASRESIRLAKHRNEYQSIDLETITFIYLLQHNQIPFCACSFIGRAASRDYIRALTESEITAIIPVVFVLHNRSQKSDLARAVQASICIDDQEEVINAYRQRGFPTVHVRRDYDLRSHRDQILGEVLDRVGAPSVPSQGKGKQTIHHPTGQGGKR